VEIALKGVAGQAVGVRPWWAGAIDAGDFCGAENETSPIK
jgi:hypothetical protein